MQGRSSGIRGVEECIACRERRRGRGGGPCVGVAVEGGDVGVVCSMFGWSLCVFERGYDHYDEFY
ncbi:hypothetical protein QJS10_CPB18g00312 [Acorus calamus]|uniref:Uncharacterized protein n=1 Tax=Acorus calamus TaxID=4465 RepID=A0AAV9CPQ2_ACOCL|nr:hypothetical protein QJS10_CPB18g00312 [Acorus calamus]